VTDVRLPPNAKSLKNGFTLIELMVVMAVVALLVALVAPNYFATLEKGKEQALRQTLATVRDAIDQYAADHGRYPDSVDQLVAKRYLRGAPIDPVSGRKDGWVVIPPPADSALAGVMGDVRSSAAGTGRDGTPYADW
jgi:general secretion pathway protein G